MPRNPSISTKELADMYGWNDCKTVSEFAAETGLNTEFIRQCLRRQRDKRTGQVYRLPEEWSDWQGVQIGNRWILYRTEGGRTAEEEQLLMPYGYLEAYATEELKDYTITNKGALSELGRVWSSWAELQLVKPIQTGMPEPSLCAFLSWEELLSWSSDPLALSNRKGKNRKVAAPNVQRLMEGLETCYRYSIIHDQDVTVEVTFSGGQCKISNLNKPLEPALYDSLLLGGKSYSAILAYAERIERFQTKRTEKPNLEQAPLLRTKKAVCLNCGRTYSSLAYGETCDEQCKQALSTLLKRIANKPRSRRAESILRLIVARILAEPEAQTPRQRKRQKRTPRKRKNNT